jgi:hypothetical protein
METLLIEYILSSLYNNANKKIQFNNLINSAIRDLKIDIDERLKRAVLETLLGYGLCRKIDHSIGILIELTDTGDSVMYKHKTFSEYLKHTESKQANILEMDELRRINLEMQNDKLIYDKGAREKDEIIKDLNIANGRFMLIRNCLWAFSVIMFIVGFVLGRIL